MLCFVLVFANKGSSTPLHPCPAQLLFPTWLGPCTGAALGEPGQLPRALGRGQRLGWQRAQGSALGLHCHHRPLQPAGVQPCAGRAATKSSAASIPAPIEARLEAGAGRGAVTDHLLRWGLAESPPWGRGSWGAVLEPEAQHSCTDPPRHAPKRRRVRQHAGRPMRPSAGMGQDGRGAGRLQLPVAPPPPPRWGAGTLLRDAPQLQRASGGPLLQQQRPARGQGVPAMLQGPPLPPG